MRVVIKHPSYPAFEADIPNNLKVLQSIVDGNIELLEFENGVDVLVDESGAIKDKCCNIVHQFEGVDYGCPLYGSTIFCSTDGEDFASLSIEQLGWVMDICEKEAVRYGVDGRECGVV